MQAFCRCNEDTIDDGPVKSPNLAGCNVIEIIWVLKFPQVQGSLQLARKVALDQVAYENEARGLKILKKYKVSVSATKVQSVTEL